MLPASAILIVPPFWCGGMAPALPPPPPPLLELPLLPQPARPSMATPAASAASVSHVPGRRLIDPLSSSGSGLPPCRRRNPQSLSLRRSWRGKVSERCEPRGLERGARVERVAETVAEQVERQRQDQQRHARPHDQPGLDRVELHRGVEQVAPARVRLGDAHAQERERRLE